METSNNPYQSWGLIAAEASVNERADFIRRTYLHLGGAVMAFAGLEAVLLNVPGLADTLLRMLFSGGVAQVIFLVAFMGTAWIANAWAQSEASPSLQYLGLGLYVVAEAVIFLPLLSFASRFYPDVIPAAGAMTLIIFGGLTAMVFLSKTDFSFLRMGLSIAGLAAIAVAFGAALFGFHLGLLFTGCMLALASGYILYDTSNVMHHYRVNQHVAAALALFASVAMLFYYVIRLLISLNSRD
jgi:FtsH-binding integral membrane protein